MADATERETTRLSREGLGKYIRTQLAASTTHSVEVYMKGSKEYTRTWTITFDHTGLDITPAGG